MADSLRNGWHAVGDGALIALGGWATFSSHIHLVGQPIVVQPGAYDLGPLEYWLLAVPVRLDPARGLLWGAALLCLAAASMAIEAAWSVLGEFGGVMASATILALIAWMPALALRPYWNPYFGAMWFVAALAAAWAVMSGHRNWWPALVVCASVAAQAHLMFAVASTSLAIITIIVAWPGGLEKKADRRWAVTGLIAGEICWAAPFCQQFVSSPGNFAMLIRSQDAGQHAGLAFGLKALAAFTEPPPLWWQRHLAERPDLYRMIEARPAGVAVAALGIIAAVLLWSVFRLRSRRLVGLAAVSLLISIAAVITFSGIPSSASALGRLSYLILVMFPAGLLSWLTVGSAIVLAARPLISRRPRARTAERGAQLATYGAWAGAAALLVTASLLGLSQVSGYAGAGLNSDQVAVAARAIERALPGRRVIALSVATNSQPDRYRLLTGLLWALTAQGYDPEISQRGPGRPIPQVAVLVTGGKVIVHIRLGPRPPTPGRDQR